MSIPPRDPEDPTRPLGPPAAGPPPPPVPPPRVREREYEREVLPDDDLAWREEMRDRIRSLRTAVALLGVLALAALAVAAYALLTQEEEVDAKRGASNQRVSALDDRVDKLESDVDDAPSKGSVASLRDDQKGLSERVDKLEARPKAEPQNDGPSAQDVQDVQKSIDDVGRDVEDLNGRVDELESQAEASP